MNEKEIKRLIDLAKKLKDNISKEKVLTSLVSAGILDDKGDYTKPYDELNKVVLETES
jgi:hypothetical protein